MRKRPDRSGRSLYCLPGGEEYGLRHWTGTKERAGLISWLFLRLRHGQVSSLLISLPVKWNNATPHIDTSCQGRGGERELF